MARHNVAIHPENAAALLALAQTSAYAHRYSLSEDTYRDVLRLDPDNAAAVLGLADVRAKRGRSAAARRPYTRAGAMSPTDERAVVGIVALEDKAVPEGVRAVVVAADHLPALFTNSDTMGALPVTAVMWPSMTLFAMALAAWKLRCRARKLPPGMAEILRPLRRNKVLSWGFASGLGDIAIAVAGLFLLGQGWPLPASAVLFGVGAALVTAYVRYGRDAMTASAR